MESSQVRVSYSVASLLRLLAYVVWVSGLIYTILSVITLDYVDGNARAAQFFFGSVLTVPSGGVLYGLAHVILVFQNNKINRTESDKLE